MIRRTLALAAAALVAVLCSRSPARAACCYFSAVGQDVNQPAQKVFLTWDPQEQVESFTVQPKFEGNARDFGMVIPTPSRPRLYEMPREFFKELAVFTILRPMQLDKFKMFPRAGGFGGGGGLDIRTRASSVRVLEAGVVGTLDYKIVTAERADDLFDWLKENRYSYAGDQATLNYYIGKKWIFTVMKIDPSQQKRRPDGSYTGEISPTRFTFASRTLIYPLKITSLSVTDQTEALFYIQAPFKADLPGDRSFQLSWAPMWRQAMGFAVPDKLSQEERGWMGVVDRALPELQAREQRAREADRQWQPTKLEWARKLNSDDIGMLTGVVKFDRTADDAAVRQLRILAGHMRQNQWVTKMRRVFRKGEMTSDLEFAQAGLGGLVDRMEYAHILPTSPP